MIYKNKKDLDRTLTTLDRSLYSLLNGGSRLSKLFTKIDDELG